MHRSLVIVVFSENNLLQVKHDNNADHTVTVEDVCESALSTHGIQQQVIFLNVKCSVHSASGKPHHWTDKAGHEGDARQMQLCVCRLYRKEAGSCLGSGFGYNMSEWPLRVKM